MKPQNKIEHPDEPETPYTSTGYVKLPYAHEVRERMKKTGRAPLPSPLLQEYMEREARAKNERK